MPTKLNKRWVLGLLFALSLAFGGLVAGTGANAADIFSVNPAVGEVVDASRSSINFGSMAVNTTKSDEVIIKNSGDRALSMVVFARFAYSIPNVNSTLIDDSNSPALDSADWMVFGTTRVASYSLNLAVGRTVIVPVSITIPKGALPGVHSAAIVVATTLGAGAVTVAKRVALMTRVQIPGAFVPATSPTWVKDSTFYEMNIRNFTSGRTFRTAISRVANLRTLGIECVILDPIFPIGTSRIVGTIGSVFGVQDISTVNTSLGSIADFRALVTALHAAGIKVVLTVPLDKAAIDNNWVIDQPNWFLRDASYNLIPDPNAQYLGSYNYSNPKLPQFVYEALKPWVTSQDVDGFSFSGATTIPVNIVNSLTFRLQALKSLLIGTSDNLSLAYQPNALVFNGNDELRGLLEQTDTGLKTATNFAAATDSLNSYTGVNFPINVVSDYSTMVGLQTETARMGAALPLSVALTFTLPGAPGIFQGQEIGSIRALRPYDADNIVWPARDPAILATYIKLVKLKKGNAALFTGSEGGDATILRTTSPSLFAFKRTKGTNSVIVVVNLSRRALTARFDAGVAVNRFLFSNDRSVRLTATGNSVTLTAFDYEIYTAAVVR
jgi:glycosidase